MLAPGDAHLCLEQKGGEGAASGSTASAAQRGCLPSVDRCWPRSPTSTAERALGVMLSGMGRDGLAGSRELVERGGAMLAQDRQSCAVWGMPRAVAEAGLASAVLPPAELAAPGRRPGRRRLMEVSDASSRILAGLLEARTGQQLTMSRRWRIETALQPLMRERGIDSLDQLVAALVARADEPASPTRWSRRCSTTRPISSATACRSTCCSGRRCQRLETARAARDAGSRSGAPAARPARKPIRWR